MNDKIIKLLVELGFDYKYSGSDNTVIFGNGSITITFDLTYQFVAVDNNIGEYTIDFDELENIRGQYL